MPHTETRLDPVPTFRSVGKFWISPAVGDAENGQSPDSDVSYGDVQSQGSSTVSGDQRWIILQINRKPYVQLPSILLSTLLDILFAPPHLSLYAMTPTMHSHRISRHTALVPLER